jgi:TolA-binding protein
MDNDLKHTADFYRLVAWAHARRKQLLWISGSIVAALAIFGLYNWYTNYNETNAAEALTRLKLPLTAEAITASAADSFLKLANDYPGTAAAARALLTAGGINFDLGKFKEAQDQFERFIREYPDSALANQAVVGVAASLEAQGKIAEATSRYGDFVQRHGSDSAASQAKSALARLYVAQNKPDKALQYYTELSQAQIQDSWTMEAPIQAEELLEKYPELRKPKAPAPGPSPGTVPPTLTLPPK